MGNRSKSRILLVGCGRWGKLILRDLKALGCIVFVKTRSEDSKQNAREGGADKLINEFHEASNVDAAVVAVESVAHFEVINQILDHFGNIPIYSEKPFVVKASDARTLVKKAPETLFVMHKWSWASELQEIIGVSLMWM